MTFCSFCEEKLGCSDAEEDYCDSCKEEVKDNIVYSEGGFNYTNLMDITLDLD